MIRLSATMIEAYRRWLENDETTIEDMVSYLEKRVEPNEAMRAGTAFHKILENMDGELTTVSTDGFLFDFTEFDGEIIIPSLREYKFELVREIAGEKVQLVGIVDAMSSDCVFDHKLTSNANAEMYTDSMQWRCYLAWLGIDKFTYNLFQKFVSAHEPNRYVITSLDQVSFYRYDNIQEDVDRIAASLIDFIKQYVQSLNK